MDSFMGTFNFMSPEAIQQVQSDSGEAVVKLSYKADVWSLGCILYNIVYGRMPFGHIKNPPKKLLAICDPNHEIPLSNNDLGGHDPLVNDVLRICLVRDPSKRASIKDLLEHRYLQSISTPSTNALRFPHSGTQENCEAKKNSMRQVQQAFLTFSPNSREEFCKATGINIQHPNESLGQHL